LTTASKFVVTIFASNCRSSRLTLFIYLFYGRIAHRPSIPLQRSFFPRVPEPDHEDGNEQDHLY
jgi:hypothetical protein